MFFIQVLFLKTFYLRSIPGCMVFLSLLLSSVTENFLLLFNGFLLCVETRNFVVDQYPEHLTSC